MASTNKTTNYELSQFEGTDKPSWEADYNADMLILDTNLKAVSDVADGASGSISTLEDRVTAAEGNITTNANDIEALLARTDALGVGQASANGRLDALEAEQIVQNTAIESNTRLGYNLARPYDSASTYAVGAYVLFQDTLYKCTTAVSTGEAFDPNKWLAIKATDEISAGGYTLPIASANTLGGVKVGSGLNIDPATGVLSASEGLNFIDVSDKYNVVIANTWVQDMYTSSSTWSGVTNETGTCNVRICQTGNVAILDCDCEITFDALTLTNATKIMQRVNLVPIDTAPIIPNSMYEQYEGSDSQRSALLTNGTIRLYFIYNVFKGSGQVSSTVNKTRKHSTLIIPM